MITKLLTVNIISLTIFIALGATYDLATEELSLINNISYQSENNPKNNFIEIWRNNLRLVLLLMLGFISLGIYSLALLCWNGFHLGTQILSIINLTAPVKSLLYLYISIEFISFCLAVTIAEKTCWDIFQYFSIGESIREIKQTIFLIVLSFLLITTAAMLETLYIHSS